jgi:hypothetical protein
MTGPFKEHRNRAKMNFTGKTQEQETFPEFQTGPKHLELPAMEMKNY